MNFFRMIPLFLMAPEGDLLTGGAGDPPAAPPVVPPVVDPPPSVVPPVTPPPGGAFPTNWKDLLPDDIKNDPSMAAIVDIPGLAKTHIHAQKMIGKQGVPLPDKHATPEDWKKFYQKVGLPESVDKYEFKAPEGYTPEFQAELKKFAFENNILPSQVESLLGWYKGVADKGVADEEASYAAAAAVKVGELKKEWGPAFDKNLLVAQGAVKQFCTPEEIKYIQDTGLGNDPTFIKMWNKVGKGLGEHKFVGEANKMQGSTPAETQGKIDAALGNKDHPYWVASHPNHDKAVKEIQGWFEELAELNSQKKD